MILLIDVGNSFVKWAWLESSWLKRTQKGLPVLQDAGEFLHAGEDLISTLDQAWKELPKPDHVWLSNVAGEALQNTLQDWIHRQWGCQMLVASTQRRSGDVVNAYSDHSQMGVDRWLGLLAANAGGSGPRAVIDCGSAITVDAVSDTGQHLGGLILPGMKMMRDSLYADTKGINQTEATEEVPGMLFANNTRTAVDVGCHYSIVAFIERIIGDMNKELGAELTCIITGGDAEDVLPLLSAKVEHQDLLVLEGLAVYAMRDSNQ